MSDKHPLRDPGPTASERNAFVTGQRRVSYRPSHVSAPQSGSRQLGVQFPSLLAVSLGLQRTGLVREFPAFNAYTGFQIIYVASAYAGIEMARLGAYWHKRCSYGSWCFELFSILAAFGVLHALYRHDFQAYPGLQRLSGVLFRRRLAILVPAAVVALTAAFGIRIKHYVMEVGRGFACTLQLPWWPLPYA